MKLRRTLFAALAAFASGSMAIAFAQSVSLPLPPFITGTDSTAAKSVLDAGIVRLTRNTGLTALAGGGQSGATALNLGLNRFTTVTTAGDSALLPTYAGGLVIVVVNATATSMNIFPGTGGTINALSANAAYALAAGKTAVFFQANDGNWYAALSA